MYAAHADAISSTAPVGSTLTIEIFDAAPHVQGLSGGAEIMRVGTKDNVLHVSDMYDIRNESSPPTTQAGQRTFEFYIPAAGKIDSVMAAGPGGIGVIISAVPTGGAPGHYTVNFPLRPGHTKFAVNYDVPYDGHATFHPQIAYSTQQLAVMIPPTMRFKSPAGAFHRLAIESSDFQAQAMNQVQAGSVPAFEISGTGAIPALQERVKSQARAAPPNVRAPAVAASQPAGSGGPNRRDPGGQRSGHFASTVWLILGVVGILVTGSSAFLISRWRNRANAARVAIVEPHRSQAHAPGLLNELKEEIFHLEVERLQGSISSEDYISTKKALERTVKRAIAKAG